MKIGTLVRRFLTPGFVVTLRGWLKYGCMISPRAEVEITPSLKIGRKAVVGSFTKIKATDGPLVIGAHVEIATGCVLLDGAHIGDGSIVTPNSVVSGPLPERSIAQGNPAKVIFTRR